ncbi:hypothetical protein FACS189421_00150 [Bacteroidia bacterium]|nr:hypothetical protein FACS189421_00150 [Bacteroidia bacterium]GHT47535.1 hypothetical protein FACS189440_08360 [Bacteroidia bacterium]
MNDILKYKNFIAVVHYSAEDEAFIGRIEGIDSVVSFEGQSVEELKSAFKDAVESYLVFCRRKGIIDYQKTYTGVLNVRLNSDLHRKSALAAKIQDTTLNGFIKKAVEKELKQVAL